MTKQISIGELIENNNDSVFDFENVDSFRKPCENPELVFLTYKNPNDFDSEVLRSALLEGFEKNHSKIKFFEGWMYERKTVDELVEYEEKEILNVVRNSFNTFYNVFSADFWKKENVATNISLLLGNVGIGYMAVDPVIKNPDKISSYFGLLAWGGFNAIANSGRVFFKKVHKRNLSLIQENIQAYDNFVDNLSRSKIKIVSPEEAQQVYVDLKKSNASGKYVSVNIDDANADLKKVYTQYLTK